MMDVMDNALWAHAKIKSELKAAIMEPGSVDPDTIRSDKLCEFGEWLYGPGMRYTQLPEYEALKSTHRRFHWAAYQALCMCRDGRRRDAEASIANGPFEQGSVDMKERLMAMRNTLRAEAEGVVAIGGRPRAS